MHSEAPPRPLSAHDATITRMQALGFPANKQGVCFGLSHLAMLAAMQGQSDHFNKRLAYINRIQPSALKSAIIKAIAQRNQDIADQVESSQETLYLTEVDALYSHIEIQMNAILYPEILGDGASQNLINTLRIASNPIFDVPEGIKIPSSSAAGVTELSSSSGLYNTDTLKALLQQLKEMAIHEKAGNIGIALGDANHLISITYNHETGHYEVSNAKELETVDDVEAAAIYIMESFGVKVEHYSSIARTFSAVFSKRTDNIALEIKTYVPTTEYHRLAAPTATVVRNSQVELLKTRGNLTSADKFGHTWLHAAVEAGDLMALEETLKAGANPNQMNIQQTSPLLTAVKERQLETTERLLQANGDPNLENANGVNALVKGISTKNPAMIELLIKHGADVNHVCKGGIPVFLYAIQGQDMPTIQKMLQHGVALNNRAVLGELSYCHYAAADNDLAVLDLLLAHGGNLEFPSSQGATVLILAAQRSSAETVEHLIKKGANINAQDNDGDTALHIALKSKKYDKIELLSTAKSIITKNKKGVTPLEIACRNDLSDAVKKMMHHATADAATQTAVAEALSVAIRKGKADCVFAILENTQDKAALFEKLSSKNLQKLFDISVDKGQSELVELICTHQPSIAHLEIKSIGKAVMQGNLKLVTTLMKHGAIIPSIDETTQLNPKFPHIKTLLQAHSILNDIKFFHSTIMPEQGQSPNSAAAQAALLIHKIEAWIQKQGEQSQISIADITQLKSVLAEYDRPLNQSHGGLARALQSIDSVLERAPAAKAEPAAPSKAVRSNFRSGKA